MSFINIVLWLIVGGVAGWLAGVLMKNQGSLVRNIVVGILGSFVGGFLAKLCGISASTFSIGGLLIAVVGACVLLWISSLIFKK